MIRGLMLTDALAYVSFRKRAPVNEAIANPGGTTTQLGLVHLMGRSALPDPTRFTWVAIDRGQISGLVSVRNRLFADIWDIDQLVAIPDEGQSRTYVDLLDHLVSSAYAEGVQRLFLRANADSAAEQASRQVGFCRYTSESVHVLDRSALPPPTRQLRLRPRRPIDHQPLFQLYVSAVPARVRQIEGMTLREWRATDGWRLYPMDWRVGLPLNRRDFIIEDNGAVAAWVQFEPRTSVLRLLSSPSSNVDFGQVISEVLRHFRRISKIVIPIRDYQEPIRNYLENTGVEPVANHSLLSRSLAVRVVEPRLLRGWREGVPVREAGM
ncbi:MAG: hypothetical protein ACUVX1_00620 [Chloroflexota bacterium]